MKTKTFRHHKKELCNLCDKLIDTEKDYWVGMIDLSGEKIIKSKFYHNFCLNDLVKAKGKVIEKNFQEKVNQTIGVVMKRLSPMIKNITGESNLQPETKVYEITNE